MNPQPSSYHQVTKETSAVRERAPGNGLLVTASTEIWGLKSGCRSHETGRVSSASKKEDVRREEEEERKK